ncbi:FAD-dependent oxidoreductase [Tateyamaria sp. SN3-11]|uniref:FAD-dependent oxidoreductase n=1 Tax=Tateyamaria sp. SN3-11 TaxID=3092147 RepID=UPI0039EB9C94
MKKFDFCIYGGTPAGIIACVTAARLGKKVALVEPSSQVGGMMTSGLNATDAVGKSWITGVSREYFIRARMHYGTRYLPSRIESKVSANIFEAMLSDPRIEVFKDTYITDKLRGGQHILKVSLSNGEIISAKWWLDATYEGDLLHIAGVAYRAGREPRTEFNEALAGRLTTKSMFPWKNSIQLAPRINGQLRPFIEEYDPATIGSADDRVQSYCIRPTLTNINIPDLKTPITKPEDFDFSTFDLFREMSQHLPNAVVRSRWHQNMGTTFKSGFFNLAEVPQGKWDMNSGPLAPINNPFLTKGWLDASFEKRKDIAEQFRRYTQAILYFIQNDESVPKPVRLFFSDFGLPADEYTDTGNLPSAVYVREGRRLSGEDTFTQHHIEGGGVDDCEAVCEGRYFLDCKPVVWRENQKGNNIVREGMFFSPSEPLKYSIPSWVMLPKRNDVLNLMSLCAVSASHVAFGSFRMEPIWMEIGNVAPIIAHLADERRLFPHDVDAKSVREIRDRDLMLFRENDVVAA